MSGKREKFGGNLAIILALAGSAVGLGNLWRFPYMVGEYGGAAFILIYVLCSLLISLPIFYVESIVGRRGRSGVLGSIEAISPGSGWKWAGVVTFAGCIIIVSYYSIVGGWSLDYLLRFIVGDFSTREADAVAAVFGEMSSSVWEPIAAHLVFMGCATVIVGLGVKKGIEKFSKIMMPALLLMLVAIMVYSLTLPDAGAGVRYLVKPDFSKITPSTLAYAMGQSFFSLSLGVGCVLTYSSYMRKEDNIALSGLSTTLLDTAIALIAGFAIIPAVFAAGLEPGAGAALVFETLPFIFIKMGATVPLLSRIASILFFACVFIAALTSLMSMIEVCVAHIVDRYNVRRGLACSIVFAFCFVLGCLCSLSFGVLGDVKIMGDTIFDFCDSLTANYIMILGALAITLFAGWKMKREDLWDEFTNSGTKKVSCAVFDALYFVIRYIISVMIVVIFVTNLVL